MVSAMNIIRIYSNKAVKELINQKPFSYLCSTNFMKMSERKIISLSFPEETLFFALATKRNDGARYIRDLYARCLLYTSRCV